MLKNVSLGVFEPGEGLLYRLQARTKLLVLFILVVSLVIANQREWHFTPYIAMTLLLIVGTLISGQPFRVIWQRLWLLLVISLVGAVPVAFYPSGANAPALYTGTSFYLSYVSIVMSILFYLLLLVSYLLFRRSRPRGHYAHRRLLRGIAVLLGVLGLLIVMVLTYPTNQFTTSGAHLGPLVISYDGVWALMTFFVAFLTLYTCSMLLTMTTSPIALMEGMTLLLTPLRWLHLPVDDFALMVLIALRFIPTLIEEAQQLLKAQAARGASFASGSLRARAQSLVALFIPFVRSTLRRSAELATALEARGYQSNHRRTLLHEKTFRLPDYLTLAVVLLAMALSLLP